MSDSAPLTQIKVLTLPDAETLQRVAGSWLNREDLEIVRMGDAYPHPNGGYVVTVLYREKSVKGYANRDVQSRSDECPSFAAFAVDLERDQWDGPCAGCGGEWIQSGHYYPEEIAQAIDARDRRLTVDESHT